MAAVKKSRGRTAGSSETLAKTISKRNRRSRGTPRSTGMAPYYPISVCRSDGVTEYTLNGQTIQNRPKNTQEPKPEAHNGLVDFYKVVEPDSDKALQWRRKLGGQLMEDLGVPEDAGKHYILKALPEGYVLWQHIKRDPAGTQNSSHAAAGHKRSDVYLYGYPDGKTKRFRSPQEFAPHLYWMVTDKDGLGKCKCKWCDPPSKVAADEEEEAVVPVKKALDSFPAAREPPSASKVASTTSLPRVTRSPEQVLDSEANAIYIYRPGELVWFNKGSAWGLAVICKRQAIHSVPRYLLQPLSHPLRHCSLLIKDQNSIRPWLAWSVPSTTHAQITNLAFDQVPWERVLRGELGSGDAEVDGSILAAKAIDGSYTLFDRLEMPTAAPSEVYYTGMFLGAEKIWVGEPVRLRVDNDDIVTMVIQQMIERTAATTSFVTLVGDIYKFVEMPTPYNDRKDWPTPDLPPRMVADLHFRNEVSDNANKGIWHEWRLLEPMARRALSDIKGRWYETRALLPILRGAEFQKAVSDGITSDAGMWMNGRGDSSNGSGQRKKNRLDTLGRAVPPDLKISRGLNGPPADNLFPDEQPNAQVNRAPVNQSYGSGGGATEGEMDQLMNLDHTVEHQDFYGNAMQH